MSTVLERVLLLQHVVSWVLLLVTVFDRAGGRRAEFKPVCMVAHLCGKLAESGGRCGTLSLNTKPDGLLTCFWRLRRY